MAVKVLNVSEKRADKIVATIIADAKSEVVSGMKLGDDEFTFGSVALTVAGDVALLDSEGDWHWQA